MKVTSRTGKPIVIADYDPGWPVKFERARDEIYRVCGRDAFVTIEHMGSTAVPGLGAKPIIDMMPGLRSLDDAPPLIAPLASLGWQYVPEFEQPNQFDEGMPFRRYFRKDEDGERAYHMHMVEAGSAFWNDHLMFRDWLRQSPEDRAAYEKLKRELAQDFNRTLSAESNVNIGYTHHKTDFVMGVMAKARAARDDNRT